MEAIKFKVGDKVRVKSLEWYNKEKNKGDIYKGKIFTRDMSEFCDKFLTIKDIYVDFYLVEENSKSWQDWMLEDEVVTEEKQEDKQLNKNDMETKLKFKIGDKVRVKSIEWYNQNKDIHGDIMGAHSYVFIGGMEKYCGEVLKISGVHNKYYDAEYNSYVWQDWMLEDEPVAEEKKEVEQLNKNDMETKEMTQKEVFDYLNNTKILCTSSEESINVQKKLFDLGFEWNIPGKTIDELKYLLYIEGKLLKYVLDIDFWIRSISYKKIEPSEILAIQIKEPKFDPKVLLPFDKVLVRNGSDRWYVRFFDFYEDGIYYTASGEIWDVCVPYNEETKHLHGTTAEEPEFYRI